jgi:hypothetical protein
VLPGTVNDAKPMSSLEPTSAPSRSNRVVPIANGHPGWPAPSASIGIATVISSPRRDDGRPAASEQWMLVPCTSTGGPSAARFQSSS